MHIACSRGLKFNTEFSAEGIHVEAQSQRLQWRIPAQHRSRGDQGEAQRLQQRGLRVRRSGGDLGQAQHLQRR
jgi:hypothetical protein